MGKETFPKVVELLKNEVPTNISRNEFCRVTGINRNSFDRYVAGLGEPTTATLLKLADYFGTTVAYLRGEENLARPSLEFYRMFKDFLDNNTSKTEDQVFEAVLNAYKEDNPNLTDEILKERTKLLLNIFADRFFRAMKEAGIWPPPNQKKPTE